MWVVQTVLSIIPQSSKLRHGNKVTNQEDRLVEYEGSIVVVLRMVQKGMLWLTSLLVIIIILSKTIELSEIVAFSIMGWFVGIGLYLYCGSELNSGQQVMIWLLPGFAVVCLIAFLILNHILTVRTKLR